MSGIREGIHCEKGPLVSRANPALTPRARLKVAQLVVDQSVNIMAGVSITEEADGDGSNGTLVIKGFNFWGGTSVMLRNPEK